MYDFTRIRELLFCLSAIDSVTVRMRSAYYEDLTNLYEKYLIGDVQKKIYEIKAALEEMERQHQRYLLDYKCDNPTGYTYEVLKPAWWCMVRKEVVDYAAPLSTETAAYLAKNKISVHDYLR